MTTAPKRSNAGLVTKDGYIKVRDGLWIASGPYEMQTWFEADQAILPAKEELHEIYLKFQELLQIQEACGLPSLRQILDNSCPWAWSSTEYGSNNAWSSTEYGSNNAWYQRMSDGSQSSYIKTSGHWVVPIRRF